MNLPQRITIREVGARDGLQSEAPLGVDDRLELIDALLVAGVTHIEIAAFVSPKAVPAMAGAAEVVAALGPLDGVVRAALVPNVRGAELALAAGLDELTVTISASATYNQRNVQMSIDESVAAIAAICSLAGDVPVDAVISCAFGSPYEGDAKPADVALLATRLRASGAAAITLADTTGMATPRRIDDVLAVTGTTVGLHLHETRGTGLLNAIVGLEAGVRRFDSSLGGIGGSPFADGAAGNVATETLVYLLDDLGFQTAINFQQLLAVTPLLAQMIGHPLPSALAKLHSGEKGGGVGPQL